MSLAVMLYKSNLIAQKNNYQMQMLNNFASQRNALNSLSFEGAYNLENQLDMSNILASTQLGVINAELQALDNSKLNYFA